MVHHVHTKEEYNKFKSTPDKLVVIDYSATWCGPCRAIAPVFEEFSTKYSDVVFVHVDVDELGELEDVADVSGVPTFKFFKGGSLITSFAGANKEKLEQTIQKSK